MNINDRLQIKLSRDELGELVAMLNTSDYQSINGSYIRTMVMYVCRQLYLKLHGRLSKIRFNKTSSVTFNPSEAAALYTLLKLEVEVEPNTFRYALIWKLTSLIEPKFI